MIATKERLGVEYLQGSYIGYLDTSYRGWWWVLIFTGMSQDTLDDPWVSNWGMKKMSYRFKTSIHTVQPEFMDWWFKDLLDGWRRWQYMQWWEIHTGRPGYLEWPLISSPVFQLPPAKWLETARPTYQYWVPLTWGQACYVILEIMQETRMIKRLL